MSNIDKRLQGLRAPVARVEVPTITCLATDSSHLEVTEVVPVNMTIKTIVVRISTATDGTVTFTLQLRDDNGAIHVSKASLPDATKTVLLSTKASPDFDEVSMNGLITVGIDPDKDVGTDDVTVNIDLYGT
jgi:hypothetical protein